MSFLGLCIFGTHAPPALHSLHDYTNSADTVFVLTIQMARYNQATHISLGIYSEAMLKTPQTKRLDSCKTHFLLPLLASSPVRFFSNSIFTMNLCLIQVDILNKCATQWIVATEKSFFMLCGKQHVYSCAAIPLNRLLDKLLNKIKGWCFLKESSNN